MKCDHETHCSRPSRSLSRPQQVEVPLVGGTASVTLPINDAGTVTANYIPDNANFVGATNSLTQSLFRKVGEKGSGALVSPPPTPFPPPFGTDSQQVNAPSRQPQYRR
jgi:hypothetical protein